MRTAPEETIRTAPPEAPTPVVRRRALDGIAEVEQPQNLSTGDAQTLSAALFGRLAALEEGTPEHAYVRNTLVELNLSLVKFAARRFRNRAEPMDDIVQVGTIGLIKAINRFEAERGVEFSSFALPTITGEMRRFFRDTSWAVQVPRRLQELRLRLAGAQAALGQELGRTPTTAELATRLKVPEAEVVEGEQAANASPPARSTSWTTWTPGSVPCCARSAARTRRTTSSNPWNPSNRSSRASPTVSG